MSADRDSVEDIGSYEREVLRMLSDLGEGQRHQVEDTRALKAQVGDLADQLLDLKRSMTGSLTGLSQRVVAGEGRQELHAQRLTALEAQVAALSGQSDALTARANAADQRTATLTGRPLWVVAGGVSALALLLAVAVVLLALIAL